MSSCTHYAKLIHNLYASLRRIGERIFESAIYMLNGTTTMNLYKINIS